MYNAAEIYMHMYVYVYICRSLIYMYMHMHIYVYAYICRSHVYAYICRSRLMYNAAEIKQYDRLKKQAGSEFSPSDVYGAEVCVREGGLRG